MEKTWKVNYAIDKQRRRISTIAEGSVVFGDIRDHQDRLLADHDFDWSFDQLIDTIPVVEFNLTEDDARTLARRRIVSPESRRAFVAVQPHIFGLGRMMEVYHVDLGYAGVGVFYSMDEALKWLERGEEKETGRTDPGEESINKRH
jgi:hypothetical protein